MLCRVLANAPVYRHLLRFKASDARSFTTRVIHTRRPRGQPQFTHSLSPLFLRRSFSLSGGQNDTIYALSTAQGRAGIAVIRISGPACQEIYNGLCPSKRYPKARYAALRTLYDPSSIGELNILDSDALVLQFPAPKTVTGEDVLELHIHGGTATVKAVLSAIPQCSASGPIRYAEPGEFTKRAFMNDRLDLAQVEALSDALSAETEQQRRAAVRGNSGILGRTYESWRQQLLLARGEIEALIDFSEDQHFDESPTELLQNVTKLVGEMLDSIRVHKLASQKSELLRKGIRISLLGPANVGKSSLMNQIIGREASIVSSEAGTTRDVVEVSLDIRGYLCTFADTAGFRGKQPSEVGQHTGFEPEIGSIEEEGIRRAKLKARESDVVVVLTSLEPDTSGQFKIRYDLEALQLAADAEHCLIIINKKDVVSASQLRALISAFRKSVLEDIPKLENLEPIPISCREAQSPSSHRDSSDGVQSVVDSLASIFSTMTSLPADLQDLLGVTERQRQLLSQCGTHLADFMTEANFEGTGIEPDIVLAAEHLRFAADCLARVTGRGEAGDVEEVLGVIFEKFCVGK